MIIAKPNPQTLFSFSVFAVASAALIYWNAAIYFYSPQPRWYNLGIIFLLAPILGYVLYRLLFQLKRIEIGNNLIIVNFLLYRKKTTYTIAEVKSWTEHQVKVGKNTTYKELEIVFASFKKITIGKKEYTDYEKIVSYLKKKAIKRENSISK
jgi:hypothetical protein